MNPNHDPQHEPEPDTSRIATESVEKVEAPEAVQAANTSRLRSNNDETPIPGAGRRVRGVEWVRPTDLLTRHGAELAGRGIDFEVELVRRTRTTTATRLRGLGDRTRRLPPLSAFGRSQKLQAASLRPGVGMS
ncbi:hypothetical protein [Arthrobacter sp. TB 23]|uniref:hypothetical protein n=1 Tax=Arthrobacter sp. TB 23 TaxID=494419 RepID=UPI0002E650A0|nr:hypothetical protein [Arthrobacter sp. TB 23]